MRRFWMPVGGALVAAGLLASPATAQENAPVRHEPGGSAHTHHVHTGSGDCIDIDAVLFVADVRGLHQGSNQSSFGNPNDPDPTRGPFHGTCDGRVYPGGPLLADVGIPPHH